MENLVCLPEALLLIWLFLWLELSSSMSEISPRCLRRPAWTWPPISKISISTEIDNSFNILILSLSSFLPHFIQIDLNLDSVGFLFLSRKTAGKCSSKIRKLLFSDVRHFQILHKKVGNFGVSDKIFPCSTKLFLHFGRFLFGSLIFFLAEQRLLISPWMEFVVAHMLKMLVVLTKARRLPQAKHDFKLRASPKKMSVGLWILISGLDNFRTFWRGYSIGSCYRT